MNRLTTITANTKRLMAHLLAVDDAYVVPKTAFYAEQDGSSGAMKEVNYTDQIRL